MKAAIFEGIEKIVVKEVEVPICRDENIIVRVKSCAVCGTDLRTFHHGKGNVKPPQILGHEIAGVVDEVGQGVREFSKGDRVSVGAIVSCSKCHCCRRGRTNLCENFSAIGYEHPGGFAEKLAVPGEMLGDGSVNKIPDNLSFDEASIAEPFACVLNGQELSEVGEGDNVVIIGAGPIGCMHVELARARGARRVIVSEVSDARLAMAKKFSADVYINPTREDVVAKVLSQTDGRGGDVIIVAAPSGKAQEQALSMVASSGRINFFGGLPKDKPYVRVDSNIIHYKEVLINGTAGSLPEHIQEALRMFGSGKIVAKKFITHAFALEAILEGLETLESSEGLKVIIHP